MWEWLGKVNEIAERIGLLTLIVIGSLCILGLIGIHIHRFLTIPVIPTPRWLKDQNPCRKCGSTDVEAELHAGGAKCNKCGHEYLISTESYQDKRAYEEDPLVVAILRNKTGYSKDIVTDALHAAKGDPQKALQILMKRGTKPLFSNKECYDALLDAELPDVDGQC